VNEQTVIATMVQFDLDYPAHRPWEKIVADVRSQVVTRTDALARIEEAKERATCSVCLARTYRGEECVCDDGGDAEDYNEVIT
jgi:L-2-hydroxyglutarate oxidase LhgO